MKEERSEGLRLFSNIQNKQPRKGVARFLMELQIGKTIPIEYENTRIDKTRKPKTILSLADRLLLKLLLNN
ncbi:MAG: hypothetical protein FD143_3371, partial [Ignavibacteria bacterium]